MAPRHRGFGFVAPLLLLLALGVGSSPLEASRSDDSGNLWIPNVRDTFITGENSPSVSIPTNYKLGEVVAEFDVGLDVGGPVDNSFDGDYDYDDGKAEDDNYSPCRDPKSKITLFPLDNFNYPGNDPRQRPLELTKEVFQLGRFRRGPTPSVSVVIEGTCCWENFARSDYKGKMLRLCKGKYNANILGKMAGNIRSLRPVKHF